MVIQPNHANAEATPATLLIIDDTPENLAVLGELLMPKYRVLVANSGPRALPLAVPEPKPNLLFLDVLIAGMDG